MKHLFILNDPPYGTERSYNALRLARELLKDPDADLAEGCARGSMAQLAAWTGWADKVLVF